MSASTGSEWTEPIPFGRHAPLNTVFHLETGNVIAAMTGESWRVGLDVSAEITYPSGQTHAALAAVDRLAADLRRQIADAAESSPR